jgi:(p)ppGpp synthase/HD superfamily hydrolase
VERLRREVFEDRVVVFGSGGQRLRLPEGATVRDYLKRHAATAEPPTEVRG